MQPDSDHREPVSVEDRGRCVGKAATALAGAGIEPGQIAVVTSAPYKAEKGNCDQIAAT